MGHVCYFRHALALDERRVKFLPEYACGGAGPLKPQMESRRFTSTKEVWFAGTHSDMSVIFFRNSTHTPPLRMNKYSGGGNAYNVNSQSLGPALRWMSYEAINHGLRMHPFEGTWKEREINESLTGFWRILELFPLKRLTYNSQNKTTWW